MKQRTLFVIGGIIAVIVIGAAGWYLVSPLFINQTVDDAFPGELPSAAEIEAMSAEEKATAEMEALATAAVIAPTEMDDPMPEEEAATEPVLLAAGNFQDADAFHQGSGQAKLFALADGSSVLRFEDFEVTNGPDLHVLLSPASAPTGRDDIGDYVDLGPLRGNIGNQNYPIPADVDLAGYSSIVIYCVPFNVVFSIATLN